MSLLIVSGCRTCAMIETLSKAFKMIKMPPANLNGLSFSISQCGLHVCISAKLLQ